MNNIENIIEFPNLNLTFNINPIAFNIFNLNIYWYGLMIALAYSICVVIVRINDKLYNVKWNDIIEMTTIGIVFGLIGARIYYVIFHLNYYSKHINEIFNISNGGLGLYGGLIFGFVAIWIYCKKNKIDILNSIDYICTILPFGQAIGRLGNFFNVEAYGIETNTFFKMKIYDPIYRMFIYVHPTFLYEIILTLSIFILLYTQRKNRKFKSEQLLTYLMLYGLGRFFIEGLRIDSLMLGNLRVSQAISLILFITSSYILVYKNIKYKKKCIK